MTTLQVPNIKKQQVASPPLWENAVMERYLKIGEQMAEFRKQNGIPEDSITMEEIVDEVKNVRTEMYKEELYKNERKN
jgi:hypothetical protein